MPNETKSNGPEQGEACSLLRELFDTYGSQTARWPERGRQLYTAHAADPAVVAMAAEARAFDRLLSQSVPVAAAERLGALAGRIVAAADDGQPGAAAANVLSFASRRADASPRLTVATRRAGYAALAASLLLGVLVGTSGAGTHAISYLADQSGPSEEEAEMASSSVFAPTMDEVL